jgi:hypothetical protein
MFAPLILEGARYGGNWLKKQAFRHSAQLYRWKRRYFPHFQAFFGLRDAREALFHAVSGDTNHPPHVSGRIFRITPRLENDSRSPSVVASADGARGRIGRANT